MINAAPTLRRILLALTTYTALSVSLFIPNVFCVSKISNNVSPKIRSSSYDAERLALVVGNADYTQGKLNSPVNDAKAMAQVLRESGFVVMTGFNLSKDQLEEKILQFGDRLSASKGVGLFYYSGHGMQVDGENYVLPINFDIKKVPDPRLAGNYATSVNLVLKHMEIAGNRFNMMILDACRDNPFNRNWKSIRSKGLATIEAPSGTFIGYATAPNRISLDGLETLSPYTEALIKQLRTEGQNIYEVFSKVGEEVEEKTAGGQKPWFASSLRGVPFCFRGCKQTCDAVSSNSNTITDSGLSIRSKKSGKTFFFLFIGSSDVPGEEVFYASGPFQDVLKCRLEKKGLTVLTFEDLSEDESKIADNMVGNEKALNSLPFASWFYVMISEMKDLPKQQGQFVSEVRGYIETSFVMEPEEVVSFNNVRGFGKTQLEARQNALLKAAEIIPESFFNLVKDKSK